MFVHVVFEAKLGRDDGRTKPKRTVAVESPKYSVDGGLVDANYGAES